MAHGKLVAIGIGPDPIEANVGVLIAGKRSIEGWYSGTSIDSQDALAFSQREKVRSMNEIFPLERAPEAYERMMASKVRFRAVLSISSMARA